MSADAQLDNFTSKVLARQTKAADGFRDDILPNCETSISSHLNLIRDCSRLNCAVTFTLDRLNVRRLRHVIGDRAFVFPSAAADQDFTHA